MSVLYTIVKVFISIVLIGGMLGGFFQIWLAYKKPTYGIILDVITGVIVFTLCVCFMYYIWF